MGTALPRCGFILPQRKIGTSWAAEKASIAWFLCQGDPPGAKAQRLFCCVYGTTEVVPFHKALLELSHGVRVVRNRLRGAAYDG
jgi:hypothetical protein